jgi:hypothetical protein
MKRDHDRSPKQDKDRSRQGFRSALGSVISPEGEQFYIHLDKMRQQPAFLKVHPIDFLCVVYLDRMPKEPPPLWSRYPYLKENEKRRARFQRGYRMLLEHLEDGMTYKEIALANNIRAAHASRLSYDAAFVWARSEGIDLIGSYCWSENEQEDLAAVDPLDSTMHAEGLEQTAEIPLISISEQVFRSIQKCLLRKK